MPSTDPAATSNDLSSAPLARRTAFDAHYLDQVLQAADVGHWEWDLQSNQVTYSRSFAELFAIDGPGPRAIHAVFSALDDVALEAVLHALSDVCSRRTDRLIHEISVPRPGALPRIVRLRGRIASWSETGEPRRALGLAVDITAEQQRSREVQAMRGLETVGRLATGVAHEINTPLQFVSDNLDFMAAQCRALFAPDGTATQIGSPPDPALHAEFVTAIADSIDGIDRVRRIVRALKEFSHSRSERERVDVNQMVEGALTLTRHEWKLVATIERDLAPALPPVLAAAHECGQVLVNLVVNAAHAIVAAARVGQEGRLVVRTGLCGGAVEIAVTDNGSGIPEHLRDKIFEPFFTTKGIGQGTGQGLAKCREIVERYGGTIDFDTEIGRGTTFVVRLPPAERGRETPVAQPARRPPGLPAGVRTEAIGADPSRPGVTT